MSRFVATEEYNQALKLGQKEYKEASAAGKQLHPLVLDELLPDDFTESIVDAGLVEIPAERIVGVKAAGRVTAFSASFRPLLDIKTEFGAKWVNLCEAHLGDTGITDPIQCYEYLGDFYVQEGNKRVSVLRHFESPRIPGYVKRILPAKTEEPRIQAYYEFLEFYKDAKLYQPQFRRPGDYGKLLKYLGKGKGEAWSEDERRTFRAYYHYFTEAFASVGKDKDLVPEEALLLWLELYPYENLGSLSAQELKKSVSALWEDMVTSNSEESVKLQTNADDSGKTSLVSRVIAALDQLDVAFVHQLSPTASTWVLGHEKGKEHIEEVFGDKILVRSYYDASTPEQAETLIEQAVEDGAQVVFTTSAPLRRETLKIAVKYPKVRFFNCSVDQHYSSIRSYYGRLYEAKFITGAIAGALAHNDRIGYMAAYPILGEPASINAFALGAQMTNPRAQVELKWSCVPGTSQADFFADGIRIVSNKEAPTESKMFLDFCNYGTYLMDDTATLIPLGTPVWGWGQFYEYAIKTILSGGMQKEKGSGTALNYWFGLDSGVIDLKLSDKLPQGVRQMAKLLYEAVKQGNIDPFGRKIIAQDGTVKNDGTESFTSEQILRMDWLCDNV
ncbi:MAG: BMP family ABC transporter substrate-binding protein, partial [Lachnospiraceae bacterium]|nr:BMP family ABC transporter substrate-binding protein [Lachnospiraceae bacterium]